MAESASELRDRLISGTPGWYSPWLHLAIPSTFGLLVLCLGVVKLDNTRPAEWLTIPITFVFANFVEWWAHKYLLHKRSPLAPVLYDQHTPKHHKIYLTETMAIKDVREFRLVLIPAYGVMLIFLATLPVAYAIRRSTGLENVAILYLVTSVGYAVSYEWLHLSYHLDPNGPLGRQSIIRQLSRHHAIHHDPTLMTGWNFNVTMPFADWVLGTIWTDILKTQDPLGKQEVQ